MELTHLICRGLGDATLFTFDAMASLVFGVILEYEK
jgi:hypothetical protein